MKTILQVMLSLTLLVWACNPNNNTKNNTAENKKQENSEKEVQSAPLNGNFVGKVNGKDFPITQINVEKKNVNKDFDQVKIEFFGQTEGESITLVFDVDTDFKKLPVIRNLGEKGDKRPDGKSKSGIILNLKEEGKIVSYFMPEKGKVTITDFANPQVIAGSFEAILKDKEGKKKVEVSDAVFKDVTYK